jgi:hypothetical protein
MALTKELQEIRASVRKFANVQGTTALLRHPDADLNDYVNRGLGSLHRKLTTAMPDQRFLASTTFETEEDVSTYSLPAGFDHLISVELTVDSRRSWLTAYEMHERATITSPDLPSEGIPYTYRLRGANIDLLPIPEDVYDVLVWYIPTTQQLASDAETYDTISRLDDYVIAYAARPIAIKDKNWDLVGVCKDMMAELDGEISVLARNRDRNSPPRITDVYLADRWGRSRRFR